ncbi:hypothetical protein, partial [uncultured Flavobacterium sp.]|uniref:hypothetical protein n=1 Tax=uncultured Flavobacterium sp. TaxID=165435 RepID=UPI00261080FB
FRNWNEWQVLLTISQKGEKEKERKKKFSHENLFVHAKFSKNKNASQLQGIFLFYFQKIIAF